MFHVGKSARISPDAASVLEGMRLPTAPRGGLHTQILRLKGMDLLV